MLPHTIRSRIMGRSTLAPLKGPSFAIINALQDQPKDVQLDALFLTAELLASAAGIDSHELITRARRQATDASRVRNPHLEAIREYAAGELR
jgi:hypothetical protein